MTVEPQETKPPFPPQYILLILAALYLVGGFVWLLMQRPPVAEQMQVQTVSAVAAYTLLQPAAITDTLSPAFSGALTDSTAAAGRLALVDMEAGTVITGGMLLDAPAPPADWLIVRLPLSDTLTFAPGETVSLYAAAGDGSPAGELTDQALVVAADDAGLTVAAPPNIVSVALGYAADGRLFAVHRVR